MGRWHTGRLLSKTAETYPLIHLDTERDQNAIFPIVTDDPCVERMILRLARQEAHGAFLMEPAPGGDLQATQFSIPWIGQPIWKRDPVSLDHPFKIAVQGVSSYFTIPSRGAEDSVQTVSDAIARQKWLSIVTTNGARSIEHCALHLNEDPPPPMDGEPLGIRNLKPASCKAAGDMFDYLQSLDSNEENLDSAGSIPYRFPDVGCEARAHLACRLLEEHPEFQSYSNSLFKVFADGYPGGFCSPNYTEESLSFVYHVAPAVVISEAWEYAILDPTLFDRPVSLDEWLWRFHGERCAVTTMSTRAYIRRQQIWTTDDSLVETTRTLTDVRNQLACRVHQQKKWPPYRKCCGDRST